MLEDGTKQTAKLLFMWTFIILAGVVIFIVYAS